jgi:sporulation integral membrane protein YtvI
MDTEYRRAANITVIIAGVSVAFWLILKYALGAIMPFLISSAVAAIISPLADKISKKIKMNRKAVAVTLVILVFFAVFWIVYLGVSRLIGELGDLISGLEAEPDKVISFIDSAREKIGVFFAKFGFLQKIFHENEEISSQIYDAALDALKNAVASLTSKFSSVAMGIVSKIPEFLLFLAALLISAFYFAVDREKIGTSLTKILPEKWQKKLPFLKQRIKSSLTGYLKAYLLIMLLTFTEMLIGLTVLKINYAFIMAIIIAAVDILPVLGSGTVLIPWAIISFATSDARLGTGLLILYGVTLIIRQIAEPRIVGSSIGLHPLATLASVYIGIKFLGFAGIFLGPIAALLFKGFLSEEK